MDPLLLLGGLVLIAAGFAALIVPGLPGAAIVYAGILLIAWSDGFVRIGPAAIVLLGLIAIAASTVDNLLGIAGARVGGASRWGLLGATIGAVVGLFFGLPGLILGPAAGAVLFEYWRNPDFTRAGRAGAGALAGFVAGVVAKFGLTLFLIGVALLVYLF